MVSELSQPFSVSVHTIKWPTTACSASGGSPCPVGSPEPEDERLRRTFLDCSGYYLVFHSVEGVVEDPPVPITVISRPKLAGLSGP